MPNKNRSFLNDKVITRGPKSGHCRICKQYGELTRDHVPPKGSIIISPVELRTLAQDVNSRSVISQSGTNFRTLCANCNNNLLGTEYDPELNKVSNKVGTLIKQYCNLQYGNGFDLPPQILIPIKPQRLARSVIGHLLASNYHPDQKDIKESIPFPETLRSYFLNQNATLPNELNIYYWFYPGTRQVLVHGASMAFFNSPASQPLFFSLVKFPPIAYMIIWKEPGRFKITPPRLFDNRNIGINDTEEIQINLRKYPRLDFPEHPHDDEANVLFINSQLTSVATKKKQGFGK